MRRMFLLPIGFSILFMKRMELQPLSQRLHSHRIDLGTILKLQ